MFIFYVSVNAEDADIGALPIFKNVSALQEIKIKSKSFSNYKECVDNSQEFCKEIVQQLNERTPGYFIKPGVNPAFSQEEDSAKVGIPGVGALDNWTDHELSRLYLLNTNHKDENGVFLTKLIVSILSLPQQKEGN